MSKKYLIVPIILTALAVLLLAPAFILEYAVVFGHSYSAAQSGAALGLGTVGFICIIIASYMWSDL